MPTEHVPPLSYLELVERNNELLAELVTALRGWEVPVEYRPTAIGWQWPVNLPQGANPALGLKVRIEVAGDGLVVTLDTWDGIRLRQIVVPWAGKPLPSPL